MKKITLSAIVIAYNAEQIIEDCLRSLDFCDEVIVVDAGSTDKTAAKAKALGADIIKGSQGNFAEQRNEGMRHAHGEWLLYIDTDERISPALAKHILETIKNPEHNAYRLKRKNFYLGNHEWPTIELLERFFEKKSLQGWHGKLHETASVKGTIGELDGYLLHYTHRTLEEMLTKTISWSQIEAQLRIDAHHPKIVWWRLIRVMMTGFWNSYVMQGGWKAGTAGLVESMYQAYSMFITYARLWEMQQSL